MRPIQEEAYDNLITKPDYLNMDESLAFENFLPSIKHYEKQYE